jgi:hypothetical protein
VPLSGRYLLQKLPALPVHDDIKKSASGIRRKLLVLPLFIRTPRFVIPHVIPRSVLDRPDTAGSTRHTQTSCRTPKSGQRRFCMPFTVEILSIGWRKGAWDFRCPYASQSIHANVLPAVMWYFGWKTELCDNHKAPGESSGLAASACRVNQMSSRKYLRGRVSLSLSTSCSHYMITVAPETPSVQMRSPGASRASFLPAGPGISAKGHSCLTHSRRDNRSGLIKCQRPLTPTYAPVPDEDWFAEPRRAMDFHCTSKTLIATPAHCSESKFASIREKKVTPEC